MRAELLDRYGPVPEPVERLFSVARVRQHAREVGLAEISQQAKFVRISPLELPESAQMRLKRLHPGTILKPAIRAALIPFPMTARLGGKPLTDAALLAWLEELVGILRPIGTAAPAASS